MRNISILLIALFTLSMSLSAQERSSDGIGITAWYSEGVAPDGSGPRWYVTCYIENHGEDATRVLVGRRGDVTNPQVRLPLLFIFGVGKTPDGRPVRQSEDEVGIVELRPGESAFLGSIRILEFDTSDERFFVRYCVSEDLGRFYGIWHGEIETVPRNIETAVRRQRKSE